MVALPDVAPLAALLGDATRAAMLVSLLDGRPRAAGDLAACAEVSPQTASNHLSRLRAGGLLVLEAHGRHRYYRLASPQVAQVLEALAALQSSRAPVPPRLPEGLRVARTCYDHLAGVLGVALTEALLSQKYLVEDEPGYRPTPPGVAFLATLGVNVHRLDSGRRSFARRCLDWSERRPHLAGALGAALLSRLLTLGWVVRVPGGRAVRLSVKGRRALEREVALKLPGDMRL
jgi:DNA-binding transcriptional ArsR family regulator